MFTWIKQLVAGGAIALSLGVAGVMVTAPAHADEAKKPAVVAPAAGTAAAATAPTAVPNKGDTAWMLVSTALVLLMTLPGLALFYGGLTRSKNILSICMQCMVIFSVITVLWSLYGYSIAFTEGGPFLGGLDRLFLSGITPSYWLTAISNRSLNLQGITT